jgi:hypothetical protein
MAINYRSITAAVVAAADKKPGHSDIVLVSPTSEFLNIALPTGPFLNPGDTKRITADHTFATNKGFKSIQCKAKSIDPTADASGEAGGQVPNYKYKIIIKGDSPHINEFVENLLNEDILALFNDPVCGINNYVQLGSACTPANIEGFAYRGGNKGAGGFKEYEFVISSSDKFFYEGTVTMAVEAPQLAAIPLITVTEVSDTEITIDWADVANADSYEVQVSTSPAFTAPTLLEPATSIQAITSLTASTTYYIRVRAVAVGYAPGEWETISVVTTA